MIGDNVVSTRHPMIMSAHEDCFDWDHLKVRLAALLKAISEDDYLHVRSLLQEMVSGYAPDGEIFDWIHQQRSQES